MQEYYRVPRNTLKAKGKDESGICLGMLALKGFL